jgi:hypothetical protein
VDSGVYRWVGLVVGGLCALFATIALVEELFSSRDAGTIAFDLVFGAVTGVVAVSSGYGLCRSGGHEAAGGCLLITLVLGGVLLLLGAFLFALSVDSEAPPPPTFVGAALGLGAFFTIGSSAGLWLLRRHRRRP